MGVTLKLCSEVLMKYYGRPEDLDGLYITISVLNGLLSLTAIVGNLAMIFALKKASSIPSSPRILLQCLALTDLTVGVLGHPLYIAVVTRIRQNYACENIHEVLMVFFMLGACLTAASFITVTFIGFDRFLSINLHLRYNELVTPMRVVFAVSSAWIVSMGTMFICVFFYFQVGEIFALVFGYGGVVLLSIVYAKVFSVARHHAASINSQAQVAMHLPNVTNMARNKNLAIKTFYVFMVFLLCYCPYLIALTVLLVSSQPSVEIQGAVQLTAVLVMLNSSLNPVVFGWKLKEVRQILKNDFKKFIFCS